MHHVRMNDIRIKILDNTPQLNKAFEKSRYCFL
ncbi:Uncharacterised protein [Pseudomonas fragi]|uniref:Uncharacterized protein n=1 Tax=Pseudomonas fragi TaxID=296 RepID=A0A449IQU5_PSEFR|nr:Uncharacterised protein [Pseudomonas fragi]